MFHNYWPVLIVDDEEDVLAISKTALRGMTHLGIKVKVFTFDSKAGALEFMKENDWKWGSFIAVALVDVVMESDEAGLELCNFLRKDMSNFFTQLYIRTGQAGVYSEQEVTQRFEVNGYLPKVETTVEKLKTVIRKGIDDYFKTEVRLAFIMNTTALLQGSKTRKEWATNMKNTFDMAANNIEGRELGHVHNNYCMFYGKHTIGTGIYSDLDLGIKTREDLLKKEPKFKTEETQLYEHDGHMLVHFPGDATEEQSWMYKSPLESKLELFHTYEILGKLLKQAWAKLPE